MIRVGIIGLPNVGKSTLFNAMTNSHVESANYPFTTIDPNVAIVDLVDERLDFLANKYKSKIKKYNRIQFYDIAGLVKNAHKGEGLGNQFLNNIRDVDALLHVVRWFEDDKINHVEKTVNASRDLQIINYELILSDLEQVDKWLLKNKKKFSMSNTKDDQIKLKLLLKVQDILERNDFLYNHQFSANEKLILNNFNFLTNKPVLYLINVSEEEFSYGISDSLKEFIKQNFTNSNLHYNIISAQLEYELSILDEKNREEFMKEFNLNKLGMNNIAKRIYNLLGLSTFFTAGPKESKAWQIRKDTLAPQAARQIHSDIERGFIKVEVFSFEDFRKNPNEKLLKQKGLINLEGKDYIIKDGDICNFKFNV